MNKVKLGKSIYTISLISVTIILLILLFIKVDNKEIIQRMGCFYCFSGILSISMIIREFLIGKYIKKKMIIKIVITSVTLVLGTTLILIFPRADVALGLLFLGIGITLFVLVPSVVEENK